MRHHNSLLENFLGPKQALVVADNVINTPIYCLPYINLPQFSQWKCQTLFFDESSGHAWRIWSRDETNETQEMVFYYLRCSYQGHHSITFTLCIVYTMLLFCIGDDKLRIVSEEDGSKRTIMKHLAHQSSFSQVYIRAQDLHLST